MSDTHRYAVADHWAGDFEENRFERWAKQLRNRLKADSVDVGFVFATPGYGSVMTEILEILQIHCHIKHLLGCTGNSLVSDGFEYEEGEGVAVALHNLPGAEIQVFELDGHETGGEVPNYVWDPFDALGNLNPNGFLVFADPFSVNSETMMDALNRRFPGKPVLGGLASGTQVDRSTALFHNSRILESGAVGLAIGGKVGLESAISQGCLPFGDPLIVTAAENNVLNGIANRSAYEVLSDAFESLSDAMKMKSRGNIHVGFAIDEYQYEFGRGDFLVRNLIGADPKVGALLVGARPRVGQTLQFQMRDRHSAMEDLRSRLELMAIRLRGKRLYGALLTTCTGRGNAFFKVPDFDASTIQESIGPVGTSGFFGNGEFGPVGGVNFVHGYTAAAAFFVEL
jgi:small ligand-binding sensory domain FIST